MRVLIALEDGAVFEGASFGASGESSGEVVFNTSMAGYQEILTDPSYKGQIVTMTYPLIGNYGVNFEDVESGKPNVSGFVVKECSRMASNWRSQKSLDDYLRENNIIGIEGIDTRALTMHIRLHGAMKAVISTEDLDGKSLVEKAKTSRSLIGRDLVKKVTCDEAYVWSVGVGLVPTLGRPQGSPLRKKGNSYTWNLHGRFKVVVLDCGVKYNILRELANLGCHVVVVPAKTTADQILKMKPDGLLLSNGPGDPAGVPYVVDTVKQLICRLSTIDYKLPIMGICLGHQMLGLALGGKTYKLKFGHHGANHPIKDLKTGRIAITVQNHGFCVEMGKRTEDRKQKTRLRSPKSDDRYYVVGNEDVEITHINLNDGTCEGMRHRKLPIFSVQFHPEASPGPHDARYLFGEFAEMMKAERCQNELT